MLPLQATQHSNVANTFDIRGQAPPRGGPEAMASRTERTGDLQQAHTYGTSEAWDGLRGARPRAMELP
jgi:hypothetical protein